MPLVVTIHGSEAHLLRYRALRRLASHVLHKASLVATVSEDLRRQVERLDPRLPTAVMRLPVVVDVDPLPLPPDPPLRLLAAGRLSPEKGFDVLVEAVARERAHDPASFAFADAMMACATASGM